MPEFDSMSIISYGGFDSSRNEILLIKHSHAQHFIFLGIQFPDNGHCEDKVSMVLVLPS